MDHRPEFRGALLLRVLGVLALAVGVFAMHSLTAHHDAAMAAPPTHPALSGHHGDMAEPAGAGRQEQHESVMPAGQHEVVLPLVLLDALGRVDIAPAGEQHEMVSVCVAVLTGLLLLLALALGLRSLLAWRPVVVIPPVGRLVAGERSPPWPRPELSKLGVLRI
ncbi:hypothetical protein [Kribbella sp. NPDC050470]|uniref:hypothetical protein n=1 Tax=unclassified Kribbella TaxID=2644121 RepID=UPI00378D8D5B